jgi:NAD(P)-dependent dehydrogenase (short-subunit alcohol dehydrogenase family)
MKRLAGKGALITGAARGIGLAIAERFVAEGARVFLVDIEEQALLAAADRLGGVAQVADVADTGGVTKLADQAEVALGAVDVLVNNAGVTHAASLFDLTEADFDRVMGVNLKAALFLSQAVGRRMAERRSGSIINMSSVNAVLAIPNQIPYAVSKGALRQLTNVTALALAPYGVRVNAIGPGTILTELARGIVSDRAAEDRVLARTPLGRVGEPSEVAAVAAFLASDDASYITGQTIYPDGGRLGLNYTVPVVR